ncbi:hypothetical protein GCM10020000_67510 [Streptomyces olivoverticillatus]
MAPPDALLDTYAAERMPVAHDLIRRTERSFWGGVGTPPAAEAVRAGVRKQQRARGAQAVDYRTGPLSEQESDRPGLQAGDRAPQVALVRADGRATTLYDELREGGWVAVTADRAAPLDALPGVRRARLAAGEAGGYALETGETLLIRPDGHLGRRGHADEGARRYLERVLGG